jgi:hypothetical protein
MIFLGICVVLTILLLGETITPIVGAVIFVIALLALGVPSQGFRRV